MPIQVTGVDIGPGRRQDDPAHVERVDQQNRGRRPLTLPREPATLRDALERLVRLIEQQSPGMRGSILLLDDDGVTLRHGAAPNLPAVYVRLVDGSRIGPMTGSCGTAVWRRESVIVRDIATDPLWRDYRDFALPHGLRACWSTPILDGDGVVLGTFAMYYDEPREPTARELSLTQSATLLAYNIIVRAKAEQALEERMHEVEEVARRLVESEARAREAWAEVQHATTVKSDFLAMMSHELRTPLNAIGGYAALMLDGLPVPPMEEHVPYLRHIARAQQHLLGLINAVLTHARIEAGRMTYRMTNLRLGELLDSVAALTASQFAAKLVTLDCVGCDRGIVLRADTEKVSQVLVNILSNAVKFTPAGGHVLLRTELHPPGRVTIRVRDTGVGMTAEQVATLFEPYVQHDDRLRRSDRGSGLGMVISRQFARGMGGELTVDSVLGQGSEFHLTLTTDS